MPADPTFYVFISYSHHDKDWVGSRLLPRLEAANLRVRIDFRDMETPRADSALLGSPVGMTAISVGESRRTEGPQRHYGCPIHIHGRAIPAAKHGISR